MPKLRHPAFGIRHFVVADDLPMGSASSRFACGRGITCTDTSSPTRRAAAVPGPKVDGAGRVAPAAQAAQAEQRVREAQQRGQASQAAQQRVQRRLAERAAKGQKAEPLPVPASSPRR